MTKVCLECGKVLGEIKPYEDKTEVGSVCKTCKDNLKRKYSQTKEFLLAGRL